MADSPLSAELCQLLECPVCLLSMSAPIEQCTNGHSVCHSCRGRLSQCPVCTLKYCGIRNRFAEELAEKLLSPCANADAGCSVLSFGGQLEAHEQCCPHRMYSCFLKPCSWTGRRAEILQHFSDKHTKYIHNGKQVLYWKNVRFDNVNESMKLVSVHGEIFWSVRRVNPERRTVLWSAQFIGPDDKAAGFLYHLKISPQDNSGEINITRAVSSELQAVEDTISSRKCMELGYGMLECFIDDENKIPYALGIIKKESNIAEKEC